MSRKIIRFSLILLVSISGTHAEQTTGKIVKSSSGIKLIHVKKGFFRFGYADSRFTEYKSSGSLIEIKKDFYMAAHEVTQKSWENVFGKSFSKWKDQTTHYPQYKGHNLPVHGISYFEAYHFCVLLTQKDRKLGIITDKQFYSLPSEVQWEYVCRAGSDTLFHCGDKISGEYANLDYGIADPKELFIPNGAHKNIVKTSPVPVASMKPNQWGFYGMIGNVGEWCSDIYREGIVKHNESPQLLLDDEKLTEVKVVSRGGNWRSNLSAGFSYSRRGLRPWGKYHRMGFRIVLLEKEKN